MPTTIEHAIPQWVQGLLQIRTDLIAHEQGHHQTGARRQWQSKRSDFKAAVVCAGCNSGWMSDLENGAKPYLTSLIKGRGRTLHATGKALVTRWGLKTAMMLDRSGPVDGRAFPDAQLRELFDLKPSLPPHLFIWLGASTEGRGFWGENRTQMIGTQNRVVQAQAMTFRVGHVVLHVLRVELDNGSPLEIGGEIGTALVRIWPSDNPITWPPRAVLSQAQTESFVRQIPGFL